jgi:hypothetical protein
MANYNHYSKRSNSLRSPFDLLLEAVQPITFALRSSFYPAQGPDRPQALFDPSQRAVLDPGEGETKLRSLWCQVQALLQRNNSLRSKLH